MSSGKVMTAIGMMAGTSLDGVDAALLRTDGETFLEFGPAVFRPYNAQTRASVVRATKAALEGRNEAKDITEAADFVTTAHIETVRELLKQSELERGDIDVIGFHGQTILHRPPLDSSAVGRTWQIGAGATLAYELRIDVVDQLRQRDMAHGGEGAPLAPIYHAALVQLDAPTAPVAVVNIGGVANITYVPPGGNPTELIAFDCGPGNGLIDQWVSAQTEARIDTDGALAAAGTVDEEKVRLMALNPYLRRQPPKSLDRYDFKATLLEGLSLTDGAATLTAFTAQCLAQVPSLLPAPPQDWIICGGGRHNPTLMREIRSRVAGNVLTAEDKDWRGDMIEAECFAYLAVRSLKGLPYSFPKTTRAPRPLSGGVLHRKPV